MSSPAQKSYLAFDLGASTSRAILGTLNGNILEQNEIHRFVTPILEVNDHLYWDLDVLWKELQTGLEIALLQAPALRSLSVDSWAVDYVPLDAADDPLRNPHCYRDPRTDGIMARAFATLPAREIFRITGIQFLTFNTLYQVLAESREARDRVAHFLPIADYFNFRFSGCRSVEVSMASTTQLMDVNSRRWSSVLMELMGLDCSKWPEVIASGSRLGPVLQAPIVTAVATCSHDTGCAVAAAPVPGGEDNWAFISCGTWSLLGVERDSPLLTDAALEGGFTNEAGLDGTIRFLKNLTGLWVLQECVREWRETGEVEWQELEDEARAARRNRKHGGDSRPEEHLDSTFIDLNDGRFLARGAMEYRIRDYCREYGLHAIETRGEVVLAILSSLAESYRRTLSAMENITKSRYGKVYLFGGGSQNSLLCQLTADACQIEVVAGPVEATTMGNLLIQARTMGDLPVGMSIRDIATESSHLKVYSPIHD